MARMGRSRRSPTMRLTWRIRRRNHSATHRRPDFLLVAQRRVCRHDKFHRWPQSTSAPVDQTMAGTLRHGGADRVRFKHRSYSGFVKKAYVAVAAFQCQPESASARDLRVMGDVAGFEYLCLAQFIDRV